MLSSKEIEALMQALDQAYPNAHCELHYQTPFQLLIAVILSAQTTDVSVNKVTPTLFKHYPTPELMASADPKHVSDILKSIGLYRNKTKYIISCSQMLIAEFSGRVPQTRELLMKLPGVGRKTANVVLAEAFHIPAIAVDTHVSRVSKRIGLCDTDATVREVEDELMKQLPKSLWIKAHHQFIFLGRYQCQARNPKCDTCPVFHWCQFGQQQLNPS